MDTYEIVINMDTKLKLQDFIEVLKIILEKEDNNEVQELQK